MKSDSLQGRKSKISKADRHLAGKAASDLVSAFTWMNSKRGFQYWADVYDNLVKIADGKE
jgi:hypothetical protein